MKGEAQEIPDETQTQTMIALTARYDGRAFVPTEQVDLPTGTEVEVWIPGSPRKPTPQEQREWDETLAEVRATAPAFPTVDEALRQSRKRP